MHVIALIYSFSSKPPLHVPILTEAVYILCAFEFAKFIVCRILKFVQIIRRANDTLHWFPKLLIECIFAKYYLGYRLDLEWSFGDAFIYWGTPETVVRTFMSDPANYASVEDCIFQSNSRRRLFVVLCYLAIMWMCFLMLLIVGKSHFFKTDAELARARLKYIETHLDVRHLNWKLI